ncbi:MAG: SDR family NAD(P)-dependent oxidoreductase [Planctomycetaceae bacterium]
MFAHLRDRRIVVTGASSGIGRAIALECAAAGADVVITFCRSKARAQSVADEIQQRGRSSEILQLDLTDPGRGRDLRNSVLSPEEWTVWCAMPEPTC